MPFPTINACIICELARPEGASGKTTLLGFFGVAPYVRIQIQDFNQPIQLCFVFAGGPGQGHFHIGLRITAPNGATFDAPSVEGDLVPQASVFNLFMTFLGVLPGPGNYTASLLVNGVAQHPVVFALDPMGTPPAVQPPGLLH